MWLKETAHDGESSFLNNSSEMIQNTIYYVTDIETFQPKKKFTKVIQKIYRMIGIKSITPEELFLRKVCIVRAFLIIIGIAIIFQEINRV